MSRPYTNGQEQLPPLESYLAIDCEMVGCASGQALAKVGMVNHQCEVVLESFVYVHPQNVSDYRTSSSGIKPGDLEGAPTFEQIITQIKEIIKDKILVGHALFNDLAAIKHRQPYESFRDTALYLPLRQLVGVTRDGEYPSLKKLSKEVLGVDIQANGGKGHDPIEDARATMSIFLSVRDAYETSLLRNEDVPSGIPPAYEKCFW